MMNFFSKSVFSLLFLSLLSCQSKNALEETNPHRYTYSRWTLSQPADLANPRGGTSKGPAVELDLQPSDAWKKLQVPDIAKLERNRRAILAMAGIYKASFEFLETVGFTPGYELDQPYQSWGTEFIKVITNEPRFISLQHIMVMFVELEDGEVVGPMVMKHWRQDWHYQDREILSYLGHKTWERQTLVDKEVEGMWTQAVYQVDDSPRYQAVGQWDHYANYSVWQSRSFGRPLPRREFSVRNDYDALVGTNRITILPTGWIHEQDNLKTATGDANKKVTNNTILAREIGLNRYERIKNHDISAGEKYWQDTSNYWKEVRLAWQSVVNKRKQFKLRDSVTGKKLYEHHFEFADKLGDQTISREEVAKHARQTVKSFVEPIN